MDCVVEAGLPPRRSPPRRPRSPYSGSGGGACDSSTTSDCSQGGSCAGGGGGVGAAVAASDAAVEELVKGRHPQPFLEHQHQNQHPPHYRQQQHETSTKAPFNTCLSLSTCGGSASNLTTLAGNTTSATTATSTSVTGSSATSTPLSGASSHQQRCIRALAQRVVNETNQQRASLDSRSSSAHRDNEEEEYDNEEAIAKRAVGHPAHPDTASPAAAAVTGPNFTSRSTPSSKRPRQHTQPTQQEQQQVSTVAATRAMHIPDIITFADSSSARTTSPMTSANTSPIPANANGSTATNARVHDRVNYEGEIHRTVEANSNADTQTQTAFRTSATMTVVKVPMMAAGSHSVTHAMTPDATPTEPAPKRFATGEGADMKELGYAVLQSSTSTTKVSSDFLSQPSSTTAEGTHYDDNEEVDKQQQQHQPESHQRRNRRHATAEEEEEEDAGQSDSTAHSRPGGLRGSTVSHRANAAGKEGSRRKARLTTGGSASSLLGGCRYTNDSITASIPYNPSRLKTPPLAQQVQSEKSPFAQSSSSVSLRPEQGTRQGSESQPSCATPPGVQAPLKAPVAVSPQSNFQQQQQQQTTQSFAAPAATPSVKLTETRYAFLALSFMMRTLCKLHKGEPIPSSDFHSHCIPPMSVTMYVQRLVRYCACSGEALLCSFILLLKYVFHSGHPITIYNAHRLLITSILLGIKLRDDVYYSNVYYGRIGGISGREMNKLEVLFLSKLNWETQVYEDEYTALLSLLEEIAIDVDPTPEQLAAFATAYPDKVAAYVPDDDDNEIEEAAAKLQQSGTAAGASAPSPFSTNATKANTHDAVESPVDVLRRKTHRGAYRLHQWHTKVEPWIAQLQQHVFARSSATAQLMSAAWQEEGQRWAQYYRNDEEAAARQQRERSASAWLSPLTVQRRATSAATLPAQAAGTGESAQWLVEPPYQSAWPSADTLAHHGGGSNSYAGQQLPPPPSQQQQQPGETNPRYNNFINFANVVTGGYFGPSSSNGGAAGGGAAGTAVNRYVSPATMGQTHSTSAGLHSGVSGGSRVSTSSSVRYHTAPAGTTAVAATSVGVPPRQPSATFDITNRATTVSAAASFSVFGEGAGVGRQSEGHSWHSHGGSSSTTQPPPSVADTTVRTASPTSSSSVPGSGINVNAQPYYYVSSRMRKQQQQQEQQSATTAPANQDPSPASVKVASTAVTGFGSAATADASPSKANGSPSRSSSFTSPACVNSATRFGTACERSTGVTASSGIEAVLAAMKRSTSSGGAASANAVLHDAHDTATSNNNSSAATIMTTPGGSFTFPARPIPKAALTGHDGEQVASLHVARRSPQSAHPPAAHRRSTYALQHSLGKKRSKPDSYKDY